MRTRLFLFTILLLHFNIQIFGIKTEIIHSGKWGNQTDAYGNGLDSCEKPIKLLCIPNSFYITISMLTIYDEYNNRIKIINLNNSNVNVIHNTNEYDILGIEYFESGNNESKILCYDYYDLYFVLFDKSRIKKLNTYNNISFLFNYNNLKIISTTDSIQFFDQNFTEIDKKNVLNNEIIMLENNVIFLKNEKALLCDDMETYNKWLRIKYKEIVAPQKVDSIPLVLFQFPDTTETKPYLIKKMTLGEGLFLGIDDEYNTYWFFLSNILKGNQAEPDEKVLCIFIFNKLGQLITWFPEPLPREGWKHGGENVVVNHEGRIFRLNYHNTKGLEIVEYLYKNNNKP